MLTDLAARVVVSWDGRREFRHGRALTLGERYDVQAAIEALDAAIASPLMAATGVRCARRLGTLGAGKDTFSADAFVDALIVALPGTPDAALEEATRRILAGEVKDVSKDWMPSVPRVVSLARDVVESWQFRRARLAELLDLPEKAVEPPKTSFSPERMAQLRVMSERLVAAAAKTSAVRPMAPGQSFATRVAEDLRRRRAEPAATASEPENETAAQRRSSPGGGETGRLVESVPTPERYGDTAVSSSRTRRAPQ